MKVKVTLGGGVETENERHLEEKLGFGPLQITESEGARGIASVCAISSPLPPSVCLKSNVNGQKHALSASLILLQRLRNWALSAQPS